MATRTRSVVVQGDPASPAEVKVSLDDLVVAWARDRATGKPRYILELDASQGGRACGCECVSCGQPLTAVNAGKEQHSYVRRPHFRHPNGAPKDSCAVLAARAAALRLLIDDGLIDLPARTVSASCKGLSGQEYAVSVTAEVQRRRIVHATYRDRAMAVLELDDGRSVQVVLTGTNIRPAAQGIDKDDNDGSVATIFIGIDDPALASLDPQALRERLRLMPDSLCWRSHWRDAELLAQAHALAAQQAREMLDWPDGEAPTMEDVPIELRRETLLHLAVKKILAAAGRIRVPELAVEEAAGQTAATRVEQRAVIVRQQVIELTNARLESRVGRVIPDVRAECRDAQRLEMGTVCFEVTVTHGFDEKRLQRVRETGRPTLEIDLSQAFGRVSRAALEEIVVQGLQGKRWVYHPALDECRRTLRALVQATSAAKLEEVRGRLAREAAAMAGPPRRDGTAAAAAAATETVGGRVSTLDEAEEDLVAVRRQANRWRDSWPGEQNLIDGLVSLRHRVGLGCHQGLAPTQIVHKLRCTIDTRLHPLVLMAVSVFKPLALDADRTALNEWAARWREGIRSGEAKWLPRDGELRLLKELLPELAPAVDKLQDFLRRATVPGLEWAPGEISGEQERRVDAVRALYRDGAYRLMAPHIDYEQVLAQAIQARNNGVSVRARLAQWSREYGLGGDHSAIVAVLKEAGLIG